MEHQLAISRKAVTCLVCCLFAPCLSYCGRTSTTTAPARGPAISKAVSPSTVVSGNPKPPPARISEHARIVPLALISVPHRFSVLGLGAITDSKVQRSATSPLPVRIEANVDGIGVPAIAGARSFPKVPLGAGGVPPDTNGAVGTHQYVQAVNSFIAVFDKQTLTFGDPVPLDVFFRPGQVRDYIRTKLAPITNTAKKPTQCMLENDGDPVVEFDSLAKRWVITQFQETSGHSECIAISQTDDALGYYYRYEFSLPAYNDYPKIAVWPNAYYVTYNMPYGARVCAYERQKMLQGAPSPHQICYQLQQVFQGLLPADFGGGPPPNASSPEYFVSLASDNQSLLLWKFSPNWKNPSLSTFGKGPYYAPNVTIPVAPFVQACQNQDCIPQKTAAEQLMPISDRVMYRFFYRRFQNHEVLLLNDTVDPNGAASAIRWYEIRDPSGTPVVVQQGTYSPDSNSRWIGSLAMDKLGDIAVGYSVSGSGLNPSIAITGQTASDPRNGQLRAERSIVHGAGAESGTDRWGDYSAMSIDPIDNCTFWYTQEYIGLGTGLQYIGKVLGGWNTRIVKFRFRGC
jgi:hypothetical protein